MVAQGALRYRMDKSNINRIDTRMFVFQIRFQICNIFWFHSSYRHDFYDFLIIKFINNFCGKKHIIDFRHEFS